MYLLVVKYRKDDADAYYQQLFQEREKAMEYAYAYEDDRRVRYIAVKKVETVETVWYFKAKAR